MQKSLFLLCPTDCLESVINRSFKQRNFFYTALGSAFEYDMETMAYIKELILVNGIEQIHFVLSIDNKFVSDAFGQHEFSEIKGLKPFYQELSKHKAYSEVCIKSAYPRFQILSYYLNNKIKKLRAKLTEMDCIPLKITGQLYHPRENRFQFIYPEWVCTKNIHLN